jgi:hypothetical protein
MLETDFPSLVQCSLLNTLQSYKVVHCTEVVTLHFDYLNEVSILFIHYIINTEINETGVYVNWCRKRWQLYYRNKYKLSRNKLFWDVKGVSLAKICQYGGGTGCFR